MVRRSFDLVLSCHVWNHHITVSKCSGKCDTWRNGCLADGVLCIFYHGTTENTSYTSFHLSLLFTVLFAYFIKIIMGNIYACGHSTKTCHFPLFVFGFENAILNVFKMCLGSSRSIPIRNKCRAISGYFHFCIFWHF